MDQGQSITGRLCKRISHLHLEDFKVFGADFLKRLFLHQSRTGNSYLMDVRSFVKQRVSSYLEEILQLRTEFIEIYNSPSWKNDQDAI